MTLPTYTYARTDNGTVLLHMNMNSISHLQARLPDHQITSNIHRTMIPRVGTTHWHVSMWPNLHTAAKVIYSDITRHSVGYRATATVLCNTRHARRHPHSHSHSHPYPYPHQSRIDTHNPPTSVRPYGRNGTLAETRIHHHSLIPPACPIHDDKDNDDDGSRVCTTQHCHAAFLLLNFTAMAAKPRTGKHRSSIVAFTLPSCSCPWQLSLREREQQTPRSRQGGQRPQHQGWSAPGGGRGSTPGSRDRQGETAVVREAQVLACVCMGEGGYGSGEGVSVSVS